MITTIYMCDKCGHEQATWDQMWNITLLLAHYRSSPHKQLEELWCRRCVERLGMLPTKDPEIKAAVPENPTIEGVLREMIREEIDNSQ